MGNILGNRILGDHRGRPYGAIYNDFVVNKDLLSAIRFIKNNEPIILPTDTVYGLVSRYDSKKAVEKIYKLKKRDRKKPLILLGYDWRSLKSFVETCHGMSLRGFIKQWPGPLTLILPASKNVPRFLNKGYKTIGIRVPKNKFLLNILKKCPSKVLASTSANISGKKDVHAISKKVKLFIKAERKEMSYRPSRIIQIKDWEIKTLRM